MQLDSYCQDIFFDNHLETGAKWLYIFLMNEPHHKFTHGFTGIQKYYKGHSRHMASDAIKRLLSLHLIKKSKPTPNKKGQYTPIVYTALQPTKYFRREKRAGHNSQSFCKDKYSDLNNNRKENR